MNTIGSMTTVKAVIEALLRFPQDARVMISGGTELYDSSFRPMGWSPADITMLVQYGDVVEIQGTHAKIQP